MDLPFRAMVLCAGSVGLAAGIGHAIGADADAAQPPRLELRASMTPATSPATVATALVVHGELTSLARRRSSDGYSVVASATTPLVCTDDTIFVDGFDL